ncbi:MAG: hybrid sensor histidine kinase/response regulator [Leptolyngbyaceae cyanobacterium RU_5_1]|nr:hybrid sensor histidine kinase/response regulator [Leptolyngbyaceae cyanobacterium RU_5_1]
MAINSDIRDQAYQFFVEEAPELLQVIEVGLLTLRQDHSTAQVHELMRAAHSLKGGSASVGLDAIAAIAHRLETVLKAFYSDTVEIDMVLQEQLLQAYDCLRLPLMEQITMGSFDSDQALAIADPIFNWIEERCGEALLQTENYIPSSADLGIDMVSSIFAIDVAQGLERLELVVANPQDYEVAGELRAQAEVFAGFAELLNLPGFGAIAETVQQALDVQPDQALEITYLALADFERSRQAILAGDRTDQTVASATLRSFVDPIYTAPTLTDFSLTDPIFTDSALTDFVFTDSALTDSALTDSALTDSALTDSALTDSALTDSAPTEFTIPEPPKFIEIADESRVEIESIHADLDLEDPAASLSLLEAMLGGAIADGVEDNSAIAAQPTDLAPEKQTTAAVRQNTAPVNPTLTIRVDLERLERMNNLVGELTINRNSLSLQNEQLRGVLRELLSRFARFQTVVDDLRELSDQMLVASEHSKPALSVAGETGSWTETPRSRYLVFDSPISTYTTTAQGAYTTEFDSLEMDRYGILQSQLQEIFEDVMQLEETVNDVSLFAQQSNRTVEEQRHMLTRLRDELVWARMLPLGEILQRFPRVLHNLATTYHKPVRLKLTGTGVLVDKAMLEKLHDPLLHLIRNAFDHGIEPRDVRREREKSEEGQIEIRAYHKGNQTIIEVKDDGQGLSLDRIRSRVLELGWLSAEQLATLSPAQLYEFVFEPGFSTADQVSELSGRGVGLDVVRAQLGLIKGSVTVTSSLGHGATFTLYLPLTLTIVKLMICLIGSAAIAIPVDSVEEILTPRADQVKLSGFQRWLSWQNQSIPTYRLSDLLRYTCPLPDTAPSKALNPFSPPKDWAPPLLILRQDQQFFALEVDRLVNEQELVIKPFGSAIAPPSYIYGCTILGDGSLVPVIDAVALLAWILESQATTTPALDEFERRADDPGDLLAYHPPVVAKTAQVPTILVVDDAVTLRRTLALSLERAGYRVLQARDGREAIEQLQRSVAVSLVVCDVEMPNMNGFEFLTHRRQNSQFSKTPVVMLTSRSNEKHRQLAIQLGATGYFTKPYVEQEFLAALKTILE